MKNEMSELEAMALTMHYYAYLNEQDVVETIVALPSVISHPQYIAIPSNDESLIGKKYNRETGEFEDVMFYYAVLDEQDIVVQVVALESKVTDEKKIEIPSYDQSLVGKWYNRKNGTFSEPPIHVIAKANTGEINTLKADGSPEDKWLHTELSDLRTKISKDDQALYTELGKVRTEISKGDTALHKVLDILDTRITEVDRGSFGGYKTRFDLDDNQLITSEWVDDGKRLTFNFDTGIPGYFPKMIRLIKTYNRRDQLVADIYIVKNANGSVKTAYVDADYIGIRSGKPNVEERQLYHAQGADRSDIFTVGYGDDSKYYNAGGQYFVQKINHLSDGKVKIGKFSYDKNSISFTILPSSDMVGIYTEVSMRGYVY
ncbi:hypothetical protein [Sinanaerobacter sp. ZZT-01]|uniref:hypothetical protein n=1 Tax=Sinanaerobacter sp. ZZT-01 TaxID=3111540 RepID=UPI002D7A2B05|nr:hypothetical protein [Sinanaerobacter sp. ZZT-01]WRR94878.1 hypothetical protein U5921_07100 [Sinanaerobacter sp. ZZT-01]